MLLSLLTAYVPQDVVALSQKAEKLLRDPAGFQLDYTIVDSRVGAEAGKGVIAMSHPKSLRLRCKWVGGDYEYVGNPKRGLEIEHVTRRYYEWDNQVGFGPPSGYVSMLSEYAFPHPILTANFKQAAMADKPPIPLGLKPIGADLAHGARFVGGTQLDVWMTAAGRVVRTFQKFTDPGGANYTISVDYKPSTAPKLGFEVFPASGYTSVGLPRENAPIVGVGHPFPKVEGLTFRRTTLVIAAGTDSLSGAFLKEARTLQNIDVKVLSETRLDSNFAHIAVDPIAKLDLMGTPAAWLVRASGEAFWGAAGYDANKPGSFAKRVRAALAEDAKDR